MIQVLDEGATISSRGRPSLLVAANVKVTGGSGRSRPAVQQSRSSIYRYSQKTQFLHAQDHYVHF